MSTNIKSQRRLPPEVREATAEVGVVCPACHTDVSASEKKKKKNLTREGRGYEKLGHLRSWLDVLPEEVRATCTLAPIFSQAGGVHLKQVLLCEHLVTVNKKPL